METSGGCRHTSRTCGIYVYIYAYIYVYRESIHGMGGWGKGRVVFRGQPRLKQGRNNEDLKG